MSTEITIKDMLQARLSAAQHCLNLNDIQGFKYSLEKALLVISQNQQTSSEPPIVAPKFVEDWNSSGSGKYPL